MGCTSSKVGQKPDHGIVATNRGTSPNKPISARAEESRSARPVTDDTTVEIKADTPQTKSTTSGNNSDGGSSRREVQVEGETITDDTGLLMRTPRRSSERGMHYAAKNGDLPLLHELLGISGSIAAIKASTDPASGQNEASSERTVPNTPTADVDERGMWGNTPLLVATQYAHSQVALALIEGGADTCAENERHATALHYSCAEGLTDVGLALLGKGADVNPAAAVVHHPCMDGGRPVSLTPLLAASIGGHTELVRLLVESGADINQQVLPYGPQQDPDLEGEVGGKQYCGDGRGMSALMGAARYGHVDACLHLVNHGASLLAEDPEQRTALMHALRGGHGEIAQALLDAARATGDARLLSETAESSTGGDCLGLSPLHLACDKMLPAVVKALLMAGAGVETRDVGGATPLLHACQKGCLQSTREIIARGGSVHVEDKEGNTPLAVARSRENEREGKELLELVEIAAAARGPEQAPETDGNLRLTDTDGNAPRVEPDDQSVPPTSGVVADNQRKDAAQGVDEDGHEDEDEDVLLVSDWASEEVLGGSQVWEDAVLITQEQQQLPRDGSVPDILKSPHNNDNIDGTTDAEEPLGEDDEDVLFVGDYVPEFEAGEGLTTKSEEEGGGLVMPKASAEEGYTGPVGNAERSAEIDHPDTFGDSPLPRPGSTESGKNGSKIRHTRYPTLEHPPESQSFGSQGAVDRAHALDTPPGQVSPDTLVQGVKRGLIALQVAEASVDGVVATAAERATTPQDQRSSSRADDLPLDE